MCPLIGIPETLAGLLAHDTPKVVTVNQIGIAVFTKAKHELGRRSSRYVDYRGANTAQICVAGIK